MALTKEMEGWIRLSLSQGHSKQRLKQELLRSGYSPGDVEQVFKEFEEKAEKKKRVFKKDIIKSKWVLVFVLIIITVIGLNYVYTNLKKENVISVEDWEQGRGIKRYDHIEVLLDVPLAKSIELKGGKEYAFTLIAKARSSDAQELIPIKVEPFVRRMIDAEGNRYNETVTQIFKKVNKSYWEEHPQEQWPHVIVKLDEEVIFDDYIMSEEYEAYEFKAYVDRDGIYNLTIQFLNYYEDTRNFDERGVPLNYRSLSVREVRYK